MAQQARCSEPGDGTPVNNLGSVGAGSLIWSAVGRIKSAAKRYEYMVVIGWIIALTGCIAAIAGELLMLKIAYRQGFLWLIACLLLAPLTWIALLALDFKMTAKPFAMAFGGLIAAGVGGLMAGVDYA